MPGKAKEGITTEDVAAVVAPGVEADPAPAHAKRPRFGMSEGTRDELARTGSATDPFTGERLTRDDLP